jgi:hypothetical protein
MPVGPAAEGGSCGKDRSIGMELARPSPSSQRIEPRVGDENFGGGSERTYRNEGGAAAEGGRPRAGGNDPRAGPADEVRGDGGRDSGSRPRGGARPRCPGDGRHPLRRRVRVEDRAGEDGRRGPERRDPADRHRGRARRTPVRHAERDGHHEPEGEPDRHYLRAKRDADAHLAASGLDWTIVRPGRLTNEDGAGRVDAAESLGRRGEIPRDDVAGVLARCFEIEGTIRKNFELLSGETTIEEALRAL